MKHTFPVLTLFSTVCLLHQTIWAEDTLVVTIKSGKKPPSPHEIQPKAPERSPVLPADGGDFLKQLPGITASRFGGRGLEPVVRGQSQTQLNVLLDGAYLHGGCPNRMDPPASYAALETYEKVTVQKGVQTLQHGSGGSGGTVLFERDTRSILDPEDGLSGKASVTGMSNGVKHDVSADVARSSRKGYVRLFGQDRDADNYKDGSGEEVRSAYHHQQAGLILGVTPTAARMVEYSYEHNDFDDALYPGAGMDSPTEQAAIQRLKYKDTLTGKVQAVEAEVYVSNVEHVMDNYSLRPNTGVKMAVPTTSDTTGGKLMLKSAVGSQTEVSYGLNIQNRERNATMQNVTASRDMFLVWPDAQTDQTGVFAEARTRLGNGSTLQYGLRVDQVNAKAGKADTVLASGTSANNRYRNVYGYTASAVDETNVGGLLRHEKALSANTTLFTGLSRSVRTADETERFVNNTNWTGNPRIKPEKHHQLDLGVTHKQGKAQWTGTIFADKVDDFILRDKTMVTVANVPVSTQVYRNVDANLYGAELGVEAKLGSRLKLSGDVAYVRRKNTTDDRVIAQTPPTSGKLQLDYSGAKWGGGTRLRFAAGQKAVDLASPVEVGESTGYGVLDAYGRYSLGKHTRVRFGVDNVLDKTYAEHSSRRNLDLSGTVTRVNEPGRTAWLKLETEF